MEYKVKNSVVLIIFNRPDFTEKLFNQIKKVKPKKLYIISDGPRENVEDDLEKNKKCKEIVENITWECELEKVYSNENLGCKKRIITGLDYVFSKEEKAIILEDDCIPTEVFFKFCDWGLEKYENNRNIGIVSGSNLLDYETQTNNYGFSIYINCWGWATWRRTWNQFNSLLSIHKINKTHKKILNETQLNKIQKEYWTQIFKHSVCSDTIWDFYLQYTFFEKKLLSVYPEYNLIENIGFGDDSTHTHKTFDFVVKSIPKRENYISISFNSENKIIPNLDRDKKIIKEIYGYSFLSTIKIYIGNLIRFLGWR